MAGQVSSFLELQNQIFNLDKSYAEKFEKNHITRDIISDVTESHLINIGIESQGHRLKILKFIKQYENAIPKVEMVASEPANKNNMHGVVNINRSNTYGHDKLDVYMPNQITISKNKIMDTYAKQNLQLTEKSISETQYASIQPTKLSAFCKFLVMGDAYVGKSTFITKYIEGVFLPLHATIGIDFAHKDIYVNGNILSAQFWDCSGFESSLLLYNNFYREAVGIFLVVDANAAFAENPDKWKKNAYNWIKQIRKNLSEIPILLLVNKCDLLIEKNRKIDTLAYDNFCGENGISEWLPISAKTGIVNYAMYRMIDLVLDNIKFTETDESDERIIKLTKSSLHDQRSIKFDSTFGIKDKKCC